VAGWVRHEMRDRVVGRDEVDGSCMKDMLQLIGVPVFGQAAKRTNVTESRTICRPDRQEELSPGVRDRLIGDPDPEHGCGSLDRENEL
jgi:hypothetical protein